MIYQPPALEHRQPIAEPFVLGATYTFSPTWIDGQNEVDS